MNNHYDVKELVEVYEDGRPKYSDKITDVIMKYFKDHQPSNKVSQDKFDMMVDVGCGSGQATVMFAPYFKEILAIDISSNQINFGRQQYAHHDNITFKVAAAEKIPVEDNSVDLIVSGAAAHWFQLKEFFKEVGRVLKPNGCMALFSYSVPNIWPINMTVEDLKQQKTDLLHDEIQNQVSRIQISEQQSRGLEFYFNHYKDIFEKVPFPKKEKNNKISFILDWSINDIIAYLKSLHIYYPNGIKDFDGIHSFSQNIQKSWNIKDIRDKQPVAKAAFEVFILLSCP